MMRRVLTTIALVLFGMVLGPFQTAEAKPPEGVSVSFEVGYDGYIQKGRINPVTVDIDNQSSGINLSGELVLRFEGTEYTTHLELPSPSQKRFFLYFPCDNNYPVVSLMVRTAQWTDEMDLSQHFKVCEPADTSIVVLTDQPGSLQSANQVESARITRDEWMSPSAALASSKSYVSYFDIDEVDDNAKFFARADSIILSDIDYLQLDEGIGRALMENVARGANLIFSLGSNSSKVAASPVGQLCPLQASGTVEVADLGELGLRYGISDPTSLATLATGQLRDDAEVLVYAGQYPAIVRSQWGAGSVYAMAFNFTDRPFRQHPGLADMFSEMTMNVQRSVDVNNWFVHPQDVFSLMRNLEEAKPMEPGFVALFIGLYVVLIGPLNFFVLGRLKRSTLVWLTIPLIIVGFSWFGLETGRLTRGADNVVASFQELHVYPRAGFIPYQDSMYVFTAEPVRYEMEVDDPSAFLFTDYPTHAGGEFGGNLAGRGGINPFISRSLDNTINPRLAVTQGKWAAKEYYFRGYRDAAAQVRARLTDTSLAGSTAFNPVGSFDLDLPWDLRGCRLIGRAGFIKDVGDLAGKGSYEMSSLTNQQGSWFGDDNYIAGYRDNLLQNAQLAMSGGLNYSNEMLLVGFSDAVPQLSEFRREHIQHSLAMVVVHLPCERVLSRSGRLRTASSLPLLTGGRNFKLSSDNYNRYPFNQAQDGEEVRYEIAADGYIDFRIDLEGSVSSGSWAEVTARMYENRRDSIEITDVKSLVSFEGLTTDGRWVQLGITAGTRSATLPISSLLQADNTIHLRLRCGAEMLAKIPEISIR
jgi:hypothetical protein